MSVKAPIRVNTSSACLKLSQNKKNKGLLWDKYTVNFCVLNVKTESCYVSSSTRFIKLSSF